MRKKKKYSGKKVRVAKCKRQFHHKNEWTKHETNLLKFQEKIFLHKRGMDTSIPQGFCGAVGNTKLVKLPTLSKAVGCDILVKLEYSQPGFSIKDRAALGIINKAKADGYTKLVEATAGNTGISLALMARPMGMTLTCVCPDVCAGGTRLYWMEWSHRYFPLFLLFLVI